MTKYSKKIKVEIVSEYLSGGISQADLAKKYQIKDRREISRWINLAQAKGMDSLAVKQTRRAYTTDFKLAVVEYVKTHEVSQDATAVHFGISQSQVTNWLYRYKHQGVAGLRDKPQGRRATTMPKKKKRTVLSATKEEQYKQAILELKHELYEAQMDRDILKTLVTITARDMAKDQIK
jgi:transposase